jgi:hypothetical protein
MMDIDEFPGDSSPDGQLYLMRTADHDGFFIGRRVSGRWFTKDGDPATPRYFHPHPLLS